MPRKIDFKLVSELRLMGIVDFMRREVTTYGTSAKVTHMVVDSKNHIIVECEVAENTNDNNSLSRMVKNAKKVPHVERLVNCG